MSFSGIHDDFTNVETLIRENQKMPGFPRLSEYFLEHPEHLTELVSLAVSNREYPFPEYSSWLLLHVSRKNPFLVIPFQSQIISCIVNTSHPSVLRNLMGVSLCFPLDEYDQGPLLDRIFSLISNPSVKPGLMVYSARKIAQFLEIYPELGHELKSIIALREQEKMSPGMTVCIRKLLNRGVKGKRPE